MPELHQPPRYSWIQKFAFSFRGLARGARGDSSIVVHLVMAAGVVAAGGVFRVTPLEWCLLMLCIAVVIAAEYFNSGLESLAKAVTRETNEHIRDALDLCSGAVLIASMGAACVGVVIFMPYLVKIFSRS